MNDIVQLASQFGAPGLLIGFMVWDRSIRNKMDRDRTEADVKMAEAITLLSERLNHVR